VSRLHIAALLLICVGATSCIRTIPGVVTALHKTSDGDIIITQCSIRLGVSGYEYGDCNQRRIP
jgi:hypothetical protein